MIWKQFFTLVKSMDGNQTKAYMEEHLGDAYTLLDVRQPKEYQAGHIPGAVLIPVGELDKRIGELDPSKPTIVYCAVGGRSRVAAQMLAGKDFETVYNMSGGIKAWKSGKAVGPEDLGLALFTGSETPEQTLAVAYGLEQGLRDFYLSMIPGINNKEAAELFQKLADIEIKHQGRLLKLYEHVTGKSVDQNEFERNTVQPALEGGLSTQEYLNLYKPDPESILDILSLAMAIEAQALDLYQRAAVRADDEQTENVLQQITDEERAHIKLIGQFIDNM
ncbi:MAG: sulfurtransferase [Desulfobulbaceae bacterium]|nr:sulfurtransferase [Desulfobulbaceae bacterium]